MKNLTERIEESGESIARIARHARVPAHRIYYGGSLSPDEVSRIEAVLNDAKAGRIAPRVRSQSVPA